MVFDKFRSWKKSEPEGVSCPSCQHRNQEGAAVCTRCYYQINTPSFMQNPTLDQEQSSDLLDQLASEIEEESEQEEALPPSFSMDDVTVEVAQYGDGDEVFINQQPDLASIINPTEVLEEEYELTEEDIPEFVNKFEVPDQSAVDDETEDEAPHHIELVQPTSETPEFIEVVSASEVPDTNGWSSEQIEAPPIHPADFDGDGKVDAFEAAFANTLPASEETTSGEDGPLPTSTLSKIPKFSATPVVEETASHPQEKSTSEQKPSFWPWHQQEEWSSSEIKKQLLSAMRAAKEQNVAEATVLLDGVGPHLGNRTSLLYSIGKLLMAIGRHREVHRMVDAAVEAYPHDLEIASAREKLIS